VKAAADERGEDRTFVRGLRSGRRTRRDNDGRDEKGGDEGEGDNEAFISAFVSSPSASDGELPRICVLERMFTDQAMQYATSSAYIGSTERFLFSPRYGPAPKAHATHRR
jgi:hypothetical protein